MQALDKTFLWRRLGGGVTFYSYQVALGITLRYWPDLFAPTVRVHFGPFKVWVYFKLKKF